MEATLDIAVAVALLTYNRRVLFERTLASIGLGGYPHTLHIVDNGSTDGTAARVADLGGHVNTGSNHTVGHGMNRAIGLALAEQPDLVVFTADDYEYGAGWLLRLVNFWRAAPPTVGLVCGNWEPEYSWNTVEGVLHLGGEQALVRATLPGSNWSFRAADWPLIGPLAETTGGEDLAVCQRLRGMGRLLVALDLCAHIGEQQSAWGNESYKQARPLNREAWGLV
jgi:glycosyltransferase involved in cell wall biosynthesis